MFVWLFVCANSAPFAADPLAALPSLLANPLPPRLQNDNFQFPEVTICFYDGYGCGFVDKSTDMCTATAKNSSYAYVLDYSSTTTSSSYYYNSEETIFAKQSEVSKSVQLFHCLLYTSPSPRDKRQSRMPSSA